MSRWTQQMVDAHQTRVLGKPVRREILEGVEQEIDLHYQILDECKRRGWLPIHGRTDVPSTVTVGSPDFIILAEGGRTIYIEAKRRTGKRSPEQINFHAWARRLGHDVHVVRCLAEFIDICRGQIDAAREPKQERK